MFIKIVTSLLHTVFPLFVPAGTILFFKFSRKKYQAKQCQKVRVQFKGVYNSRACTIRGNTVNAPVSEENGTIFWARLFWNGVRSKWHHHHRVEEAASKRAALPVSSSSCSTFLVSVFTPLCLENCPIDKKNEDSTGLRRFFPSWWAVNYGSFSTSLMMSVPKALLVSKSTFKSQPMVRLSLASTGADRLLPYWFSWNGAWRRQTPIAR